MDAAITVIGGCSEGEPGRTIGRRISGAVSSLRRHWPKPKGPVEWQTFERYTPLFGRARPLVGVYGEEITGLCAARRWNGEAIEYRSATKEEGFDLWDSAQW